MTADKDLWTKGPHLFDKAQAKTAVNALLKYVEKKKSDTLFLDAPTRFLLDIQAFKTPSGTHEFYNIVLPNSPYPNAKESLDILLVVRDMKDVEPEHVIGQVKDELRDSCKRDDLKIRQIMTLKQLKDDYSTFEAKRALAKSIDVVVCEHAIFKTLPRILGREFHKKKKFHLDIPGRQFKKQDLGEQILYALQKTVLHISLKGQTSTIVVGHNNLNAEDLADNVSKIAHWLKKKFPGGWKNIQKLSIHTGEGMPPLVVYFSTGSANDVKKPPVTKGGSVPDSTEGEISTQPGAHLRVHPTGEIEVFPKKRMDKEDIKLIHALADKPFKKNRKNKSVIKEKKEPKDEVKDETKEEESEEVEEDSDDQEEMDDADVVEQDEEEMDEEEGEGDESSEDDEDE